MEQEDRDRLIRMEMRQETQLEMLKQHVSDSKEARIEYLGKLANHNDRLLVIETKQKPFYLKIFTGIGAFFGLK